MEIDEDNSAASTSDKFEESTQEYIGFYEDAYQASPKIQLASYFSEYMKLISPMAENGKRNIVYHMGTDTNDEELKILAGYCSIDNLTVPGEMSKRTLHRRTWRKEIFDSEDVPTEIELETVKASKKRAQMKNELKILKYRSETPIHYENEKNPAGPSAVVGEDILVNVRIYLPFSMNTTKSVRKFGKVTISSVITILGSQTLADLRDQITCPSDYSISKDISDDLTNTSAILAKDVYPSGFFYIEGTFYNDTRHPFNIDYSRVIRDWSQTHDHGPFNTASMEDTRIDSLSLRFGFPWVYQHQGRCEHIILFSDARLFNNNDERSLSAYPRISRIKPQAIRYCMTCGVIAARWITVDNDRLPHNPCLFCDACFKSYNYVDGKKLGNFKAYPYPSNNELACSESNQA